MSDVIEGLTEQMREQIVSGAIAPGARIFEAQIARERGVNRTQVREAARRLEKERLLVSKPNMGFLVREFTIGDFTNLVGVRVAVERFAMRSLLQNNVEIPALVNKLKQLITQIKRCTDKNDLEGEVEVDFEFHRTLVAAAGNKLLLSIFDELAAELRIVMRLMGYEPIVWNTLPEQHHDLIDAVLSGDPDRAEREIEQHCHIGWTDTIAHLRSRTDVPLSIFLAK